MKILNDKLKSLNINVLSKDKSVLPDFALVFYELHSCILPIKSILEETIACPDVRISASFQDMLIEQALSPEQMHVKESFSFANREQELEKEFNATMDVIQRRLQEQVKTFNGFVRNIRTPELEVAERNVKKIFAFYDLCCFDFNAFFTHFSTDALNDFKPMSSVIENNNFKPVFIDDIMPQLLDLNFLLKNLEVDGALIKSIQSIYTKIGGTTKDKFLFVSQQLENSAEIIKNKLGYDTVLNIIRIGKDDPWFEDSTPQIHFEPIQEYVDRLDARFDADSKKLLMFYQEAKIRNLIRDIFGDQKLFEFTGYNDTVNKQIQNLTTLSFEWVRPLELLRTFNKRVFEQYMKKVLKDLLVEGLFNDVAFQQSLSETYYYCESLPEKFESFSALMDKSSKYSLETIEGYLHEISKGGNFEEKLAKIVNYLNVTAKNLVQEAVTQYTKLYKSCNMIIADTKTSRPEHIGNIRSFATSVKMRKLFEDFEREVKGFNKFLQIMKNYAVLVDLDNNNSIKEI